MQRRGSETDRNSIQQGEIQTALNYCHIRFHFSNMIFFFYLSMKLSLISLIRHFSLNKLEFISSFCFCFFRADDYLCGSSNTIVNQLILLLLLLHTYISLMIYPTKLKGQNFQKIKWCPTWSIPRNFFKKKIKDQGVEIVNDDDESLSLSKCVSAKKKKGNNKNLIKVGSTRWVRL